MNCLASPRHDLVISAFQALRILDGFECMSKVDGEFFLVEQNYISIESATKSKLLSIYPEILACIKSRVHRGAELAVTPRSLDNFGIDEAQWCNIMEKVKLFFTLCASRRPNNYSIYDLAYWKFRLRLIYVLRDARTDHNCRRQLSNICDFDL